MLYTPNLITEMSQTFLITNKEKHVLGSMRRVRD